MYRLRKCDKLSDADDVYEMIRQLAISHDCLNLFEISLTDFRKDGFQQSPPLFHVVMAEHKQTDNDTDWKPVGYAMWYYVYCAWKGSRCLDLDDCKLTHPFFGFFHPEKNVRLCMKVSID